MTTILVLCAVGVAVWYFMFSGKAGGKPSERATITSPRSKTATLRESPAVRKFNANHAWLKARWAEANQKRQVGDTAAFPSWYFDSVTDKQLKRIGDEGLELSTYALTKGQASDIIGLFEDADDAELEILKFFKVPTAGMNQTVARVEVPKLIADPAKAEAWRTRPAEALQKEALRFYGLSIPKGLTYPDAEGLISRREVALAAEESPLPDEWDSYKQIIEAFSDREACEDYGLRKPGLPVIRAAVDALRAKGETMEAIADDLDSLAQRIIEAKPELERPE